MLEIGQKRGTKILRVNLRICLNLILRDMLSVVFVKMRVIIRMSILLGKEKSLKNLSLILKVI